MNIANNTLPDNTEISDKIYQETQATDTPPPNENIAQDSLDSNAAKLESETTPKEKNIKSLVIRILLVVFGLVVLVIVAINLLLFFTVSSINPEKQLETVQENRIQKTCADLVITIEINSIDYSIYPWEKIKDVKTNVNGITPLVSESGDYNLNWFDPEKNTELTSMLGMPKGDASPFKNIYFLLTEEQYGFCYIPSNLVDVVSNNANFESHLDKYACITNPINPAYIAVPEKPASVFGKFTTLQD